MAKFSELEGLIVNWAIERGIVGSSSPQSQLLKTVSELGELADATIKNDDDGIDDGLGDVLVTLIIYAYMMDRDLKSCLQSAYDTIKDRKGKMSPGGAFVKETP